MPILHMETTAVRGTGQQINQMSESLRQQAQQLTARTQQLAHEWQGPSATMFEQEMQALLQRAQQAAEAGGALNQKVQKEVDQWERVAANLGNRLNDLLSEFKSNPNFKLPNDVNVTQIEGFEHIKPFNGDLSLFPGPYGRIREDFLDLSDYFIDSTKIRTWVHEAASYNDVPPELLAVILQQENAPDAPQWRKPLQYVERQGTTVAGVLNEVPLVGKIIPDKIANGSSGIGNMSKATLDDTVQYIETTYGRTVMPSDVLDTAIPNLNRDTRISGVDMQADIYYVSAHLRQLIDRVAGDGEPYHGTLTKEQIESIAAAYNGSGDAAQKYGQDTINRLEKANTGEIPLYFY